MKFIVVFIVLVAIASARRVKKPQSEIDQHFRDFAGEEDINLITQDDDAPPTNFVGDVMKAQVTSIKTQTGAKKFNYNFETQNGIKIASIGKLKDNKTFVVSGSYTYTGADGKRYRVRYTADEFGYHPVTEEDTEPDEVVPAPVKAPAPAPATASRFSPLSSFQNGNKFGNQNNQFGGQNGQFGRQNGGQNGQFGGQNGQFGGKNGQFGGQNGQFGGNNGQFDGQNGKFGNQNGFQGYNGNNEQQNGFGKQNNQFGGRNGLNGLNGGQNGLNNGKDGFGNGQGNGQGNGLGNGQGNGIGGPNSNGFNTVNRSGSYDRTGKSLDQDDLIFNKDFVSALYAKQDTPNRLYLPSKPVYSAPTYLPPQ